MEGPHRDYEEEQEEEIKPTWKDFVAMTIAAYEVILIPMLVIFGVLGGVILLFYLVF